MGSDSDVLIVGGGPVGMLTALALAQTGAKVRVIEREPAIINSPRAAAHDDAERVPAAQEVLQDHAGARGVAHPLTDHPVDDAHPTPPAPRLSPPDMV